MTDLQLQFLAEFKAHAEPDSSIRVETTLVHAREGFTGHAGWDVWMQNDGVAAAGIAGAIGGLRLDQSIWLDQLPGSQPLAGVWTGEVATFWEGQDDTLRVLVLPDGQLINFGDPQNEPGRLRLHLETTRAAPMTAAIAAARQAAKGTTP